MKELRLTEQPSKRRVVVLYDYQRDEDHDGEGDGTALLKPPLSSRLAHAFHASQLFRNCALASSNVATRSERVIGPLTVIDQNQRRSSGPPRVS
jgi:hypothetical protein